MELEREVQYFLDHQDELAVMYPGKFVVVKNDGVIGGFQTIQEALGAGASAFGLESFLVRRTDEKISQVSIPALTLGILVAGINI